MELASFILHLELERGSLHYQYVLVLEEIVDNNKVTQKQRLFSTNLKTWQSAKTSFKS